MDRERLFLETVRENRYRMYRVAMSLLHSGADAEVAVSAAVENAWNHPGRLRNPDALSACLVRCTVNVAKNELRRIFRRSNRGITSIMSRFSPKTTAVPFSL